jgi:tRNA pseudouridine55 synthase
MQTINAWLNLYKDRGLSSNKALTKLKKLLHIKKLGHMGTLDPLAEGVLPVAVGEATKSIPFIQNNIKEYEFDVTFGTATNTDDQEGEVIATSKKIPSKEEIQKIIPQFTGKFDQIPPLYSALNINGKRAYKLALKGELSLKDLEKRPVNVLELILINQQSSATFRFKVKSEKGFYVRALARDIAKSLNTKGHITYLKRTQSGYFTSEKAHTINQIKNILEKGKFDSILTSIATVLEDIPALPINEEQALALRNGKQIELSKTISVKKLFKAILHEKLVAIVQINEQFAQPIRVFNLLN